LALPIGAIAPELGVGFGFVSCGWADKTETSTLGTKIDDGFMAS
jgi:hypothetical protein